MNIMTDMTYDECWIGIRQFKNTSENQWEDFYWVDGSPISYDYYLPPWKSGKLTDTFTLLLVNQPQWCTRKRRSLSLQNLFESSKMRYHMP